MNTLKSKITEVSQGITVSSEPMQISIQNGDETQGNSILRKNFGRTQNSDGVSQAEKYAQAIITHSERSHESFLWSGVNYRQLAQFLRTPRLPCRQPSSTSATDCFPLVISHTIHEDGTAEIRQFDASANPCKLVREAPQRAAGCQLVFIRGFLSTPWLMAIGSQYRIDPEYFRRHLDFLQPNNYFDLPPLPSGSRNIVQLHVTTVFARQLILGQKELDLLLIEEEDHIQRHQKTLSRAGDSIVRRFSVHDTTYFTLEQYISICINGRSGKGWEAIIWVDTGRDLNQSPAGPWLDDQFPSHTLQAVCHPIIGHIPKIALERRESSNDTIPVSRCNNLIQSTHLLPLQYGLTLDRKVAAVDSLYALSEIFFLVASSERQFMNMIEQQIRQQLFPPMNRMEQAISSLNHSKALIDDHAAHIDHAIRCLKNHGDDNWPKAQEHAHIETAERTRNCLLDDFLYLQNHAKVLSERCVSGISSITNRTMLEEARKGILQGAQTKRLTLLAFLYLPLSLTAAGFGMNFKELGTGNLKIWWFFVTVIPITAISVALCFWGQYPVIRRAIGSKNKKATNISLEQVQRRDLGT